VARITAGQTELWEGRGDAEVEVELPLERGGLDLRIRAVWPPGTPRTVVEVILEPDGYEPRKQTFWSEGNLNEVAGFSFNP
jgi:hypothetical protein